MNRTIVARPLRSLLVACFVAVVFPVVVGGLGMALAPTQAAVLLPFVAATIAVAGLGPVLAGAGCLARRLGHDLVRTPYSALAEAAARIRAGSLDDALSGLARVVGEGTGARRSELWLAVGDRLVSAACYPPAEDGADSRTVESLAALLAEPGTDHAVPVMEGPALRAVLAISKPGQPVTPADQLLMRDVANGARMLLWGVAMNAELAERVRRADELAGELLASRHRLSQAREAERRRLVTELDNVATGRLADLRADLAAARAALLGSPDPGGPAGDVPGQRPDPEAARAAIVRARVELDELLDRFRVIARGVYPAVLRDQGPYGALEEVAADLPRPVQLSGRLPDRLAWEVESGIYYLAASAMRELAGSPAERPLRVQLAHVDARLCARVDDPCPSVSLDALRDGLSDESERLAALGGALELSGDGAGGLVLRAWLPDELEPAVDLVGARNQFGGDQVEADSAAGR